MGKLNIMLFRWFSLDLSRGRGVRRWRRPCTTLPLPHNISPAEGIRCGEGGERRKQRKREVITRWMGWKKRRGWKHSIWKCTLWSWHTLFSPLLLHSSWKRGKTKNGKPTKTRWSSTHPDLPKEILLRQTRLVPHLNNAQLERENSKKWTSWGRR